MDHRLKSAVPQQDSRNMFFSPHDLHLLSQMSVTRMAVRSLVDKMFNITSEIVFLLLYRHYFEMKTRNDHYMEIRDDY
jgi:hypothetical protein